VKATVTTTCVVASLSTTAGASIVGTISAVPSRVTIA
jgi:hypothetical protein